MVLLTTVTKSIEEVRVDEKVRVQLIRYAITLLKGDGNDTTGAVLQFDTESRYAAVIIGSLQPIDAPPSMLFIPGKGKVALSYVSDHVYFAIDVYTRFEILRYGSGGALEYVSTNTSNPFGTLTGMMYELWSPRWAKKEIMIKAMRTSDFANVYEPSRPFARPWLRPIELQQLTLPSFLI
jgi:hypothetical protein